MCSHELMNFVHCFSDSNSDGDDNDDDYDDGRTSVSFHTYLFVVILYSHEK